jgi:signal transduction histidine kinase/ActR/RegA family two-component response regulator
MPPTVDTQGDPGAAAEIGAERVAAAFRQTPHALAVTIINAGLVAALLTMGLGQEEALHWLGAVLAVVLLRFVVWRAYRRSGGTPDGAGRWGFASAACAAAAGIAWSAGAIWLWPENEGYRLFWIFAIGGMSAGAAALYYVHLPTALAFILASGLPLAVRVAMDGTERAVVAGSMIVVYVCAMALSTLRSSAHYGEMLGLRFDLARRTRELDAINARLQTEIAGHRETESHLRHAQKLEAVGQLAGGIAHDFNNILQAVSSGAAMIQRRAGDQAAVVRLVGMVAEAARRGESVTRRLLAFARRGDLSAEAIEVPDLLAGLQEVLGATLPPNLRVAVRAEPGLPAIFADRGQLETSLVNLCINARDAMPDGGQLTLSAERASAGAVRIVVADTGTGMNATTLARATEPFFTTKPQGRGTGLGLAMARGFVEASGGTLSIDSAPGQGTRVALTLPIATEPRAVAAATPAGSTPPLRILLVDDERAVREFLSQELSEEGHNVAVASDGYAALAQIDRGLNFDLVISDLAMPGLDGVAVIREVRRRRPRLPAILLTGHAGEAVADSTDMLRAGGAFQLLRKPVNGTALAERAAQLLETAGRRPIGAAAMATADRSGRG